MFRQLTGHLRRVEFWRGEEALPSWVWPNLRFVLSFIWAAFVEYEFTAQLGGVRKITSLVGLESLLGCSRRPRWQAHAGLLDWCWGFRP